MKKRNSIISTLVMIIGFVFVILAAVQIFAISKLAKKSTGKSYSESCEQITQAYSLMLTNRLTMYNREIRLYVDSDAVKTQNIQTIVKWMCDRQDMRNANIDGMYFCTPDGTAYRDNGTVNNVSQQPFFKAIIEDGNYEYVSNPVIDPITKKPIIYVAQVVIVNGNKLGLFAAIYPLSTIQKLVSDIQVGNSGSAWLLDGDGLAISYPVNGFAMKKNFLKDLGNTHNDMKLIAEQMCAGKTGSGWINSFTSNKKEFVTYTSVHNTPWSIGFTISEDQVYETGNTIFYIMIGSSTIMALILLVLCAIILFRWLSPLKTVEQALNEISTGKADLTKRINISSNNEIGEIVNNFNNFTNKMQSIVTELKKSKQVLLSAGNNLTESTKDSSNAILEIKNSISETTSRIVNQSAGVEETSAAVNEIATNISSLERMIDTQTQGVKTASNAIELMIKNIDSVNLTIEKMADSFVSLTQNAIDGKNKQVHFNEKISQIEQESLALENANEVIANIAEQTNLLAMNAAIEAAHAGASGKGFSVVADEIRKLSVNSTAQSQAIGERLKKISDSISNVVEASQESSSAFDAVANGIKATNELVQDIKTVMNEQKTGSAQIVAALQNMNNSTTEVHTASVEMSEGNKQILQEVKSLKDSTMIIKDCIEKMNLSARQIDLTGTQLVDITSQVGNSISAIGSQIDQFDA